MFVEIPTLSSLTDKQNFIKTFPHKFSWLHQLLETEVSCVNLLNIMDVLVLCELLTPKTNHYWYQNKKKQKYVKLFDTQITLSQIELF